MAATINAPEVTAQVAADEKQFVADSVLAKLGTPKNLARVDVRPLWGRHYRVNVFCDDDRHLTIRTVQMTDSFFVTADNGDVTSHPNIERKYPAASTN